MVENATFVRLRGYLARVLGWDAENRKAIDLALYAIRAAIDKRARLELVSTDDLVAVARQIHLRTCPPDAPFVVCGKDGRGSDDSIRVTAEVTDASEALALAADGTVCVRADDLPGNYAELRHAAIDPDAAAQLFVCAKTAPASHPGRRAPLPVVVPELAYRTPDDLHQIILDYALDACREFGAGPSIFSERDRALVMQRDATSFADIEIATLRIVALHVFGNPHQAAARLGLSHVALGKWLKLRGLVKPRE